MGLFDTITIDDSIEIPEIENPPREGWQTKQLKCKMQDYKISKEGYLLREQYDVVQTPKEERPNSDSEEGSLQYLRGSLYKINQEWTDTEYHGIFEMHTSIDGEYTSYNVKFTDGELQDITRRELE